MIAETNSSDVLSVDLTTSGLTMCDGPLGPVKSKGVGTPDQVLTTLDRPRAQSLMGTPLRQAWVQVIEDNLPRLPYTFIHTDTPTSFLFLFGKSTK